MPGEEKVDPGEALRAADRRIAAAVGVLSVCLLVLSVVAVETSLREVRTATQVYGLRTLRSGGSAGIRLAVYRPAEHRFESELGTRAWLEWHGRRLDIAAVVSEPGRRTLTATFDVPHVERAEAP